MVPIARAIGMCLSILCACVCTADDIDEMPRESNRYALLIGVQDYEDAGIVSLDGPNNDVAALRAALRMSGFEDDHIEVLASDQPTERKPTRTRVVTQLRSLKDWVSRDGLLVVAFSGHGFQPSSTSEVFLLPSDVVFKADAATLQDTAIPLSLVRNSIAQTKVRKVLVLVDACRDQFQKSTLAVSTRNPLTQAYEETLKWDKENDEVEAYATLFATRAGYPAYIYKEKKQSYFTWVLVEGLMGKAVDERKRITLSGLQGYLEDRVPFLVKKDYGSGALQQPYAEIAGFKANNLLIRSVTSDDADFSYIVSGKLRPTADVPVQFHRTFNLEDQLDSCGQIADKVVTYCLDRAESEVQLEKISNLKTCSGKTTLSPAVSRDPADPRCVNVGYHLEGCATNQLDVCSERPGLSAELRLGSTRLETKVFDEFDVAEHLVAGSQFSEVLQYPKALPSGSKNVRWIYNVTVLKQAGIELFSARLTADRPSMLGVTTDVSNDGRLTIDVSEAMKIWRGLVHQKNAQDTASSPKPDSH